MRVAGAVAVSGVGLPVTVPMAMRAVGRTLATCARGFARPGKRPARDDNASARKHRAIVGPRCGAANPRGRRRAHRGSMPLSRVA